MKFSQIIKTFTLPLMALFLSISPIKSYALDYATASSVTRSWYLSNEGCQPTAADINYWSNSAASWTTSVLLGSLNAAYIQNGDYRYKRCQCDYSGVSYWNLGYNATSYYFNTAIGSCVYIPPTPPAPVITTKTRTELKTLNCPSGFTGTMIALITYQDTYSDGKLKQTTVTSVVNNTNSCVAVVNNDVLEVITESSRQEVCVAPKKATNGKNYDLFKKTTITTYVKNANGTQGAQIGSPNVYEYLAESNCQVDSSIPSGDDSQVVLPVAKQKTLISNLTIISSLVYSNDTFTSFVKNIKKENIKSNEVYKLNIIIDDLNPNNFNSNKLSDFIVAYQSLLSGQASNVKVFSIPQSLEKYIGQGDITADTIKMKKYNFKSAKIEGQNIILKYYQFGQNANVMPVEKSAIIPVFNSSVNISNIQ